MDLNKLLKLSIDLICTVNARNEFVEVSEASYTILGYQPSEMTGRSYKEFILAADLVGAEQAVSILMTKRPDTQIQMRYLHKEGQVIPLLWCVNWDEEDQLFYCVARSGLITEQTELMRKSLEESNQRYKYVTKATSDAIWDWDIINGTLFWGEGFELIFGYKLSNVIGDLSSWTRNLHTEDAEYILQSIDNICKSEHTNWKEEYRYQRADGTYADVVDRGFVIRDKNGMAVRMVGAMHDISERKKTLKEIKQVTSDLCKRNQELHEFGYIVSHGLRAPVANIKGLAALMQMESEIPEPLKPFVTQLSRSVVTLDEVIFDLSQLLSSKNRTLEPKMELLDLQHIVNLVADDLDEEILRNRMKLVVINGGLCAFNSYQPYLYSIFHKLISNSIKFQLTVPPAIHMHISQSEKTTTIIYKDNGCGIDLLKHGDDIFKPYARFHPTIKGKGLGLFLVKNYVEALNGSISIDSKPDEGVLYKICFPK